jgi:hypothetical protein
MEAELLKIHSKPAEPQSKEPEKPYRPFNPDDCLDDETKEYLIKAKKELEHKQSALAVLKHELESSSTFNIPLHIAQQEAVKLVAKTHRCRLFR